MTEREVFLKALEIEDSGERAALLDRLGDADLRRRVEALLKAHDEAGGFLRAPHPAAGADDQTGAYVASTSSEEKAGATIAGRYKLLERIGEGGMGAVWMADQLEPVKRRVAVKLIRSERDGSASILSRFEAERQAIALMDHPNIAKLLDAGKTELGAPFFVMELVKGSPLTDFCDEHRLSVAERLNLFIQICSAVQHAHQKGIIHRDLKPTNILVEMHDDKPVPKVIDFGLAKAMSGQPLTERTLFTGFGTVAGTPLYMAPEQAKFNAVDVDTRADVYALGVILYELLTGSTPIERATFKQAALDEMLRVIRESEPPTPSKRLSSSDAAPSIAASRQSEPAKLGSFVRGELDWIVMKALSKERDRRYETANGFAKDVERFLNHEPVQAGPPTAGYKLRKFVQRNRGQVVAMSIVLLTLVAGVIGTTLGLLEARKQAEFARKEADAKDKARAEEAMQRSIAEANEKKAQAAKAEALSKEAESTAVVKFFEEQVFAAARPRGQVGGLGKAVTLRDAITASLPKLTSGFPRQPLVEARLRMSLGITFSYLDESQRAMEQFERARTILVDIQGHEHPDTLKSMTNLAGSYIALGRHEEALLLNEKVLAIRKRVLPPDHQDILMSMGNLASIYSAQNRDPEALKLREETLAAMRRILPVDHPIILQCMNDLGVSYFKLNRHEEALKLRQETLKAMERVLPPDHPQTLKSMNNLASSYEAVGRRAEALKLNEETLSAMKHALPPDHQDILKTMTNLAISYRAQGRHEEAKKLGEEVLTIRRRVLPPNHALTLASIQNLAMCYLALNRSAEALPLIEEFLTNAREPAFAPGQIAAAIRMSLEHFHRIGDVAGCRSTAEMLEQLSCSESSSLRMAACCRAVTASMQSKVKGADSVRLAKEDADKAMAWLTKAVAAGSRDAVLIKGDPDFDFLRDRADFKKLIAELEAGSLSPKTPAEMKKPTK